MLCKTGTTTQRDSKNSRKESIVRRTLLSLKMGHKEGQLYTFTAVMFSNTKGPVHSPVRRCSAQPDVIYSEILSASNHAARLKINLSVVGTFVTCCWVDVLWGGKVGGCVL